MWPELCRVGPFTLHTYGVIMAAAFVVAVGLARAAAHDPRTLPALNEAAVLDWAVWAMFGGIIGGRLLYVLLNPTPYKVNPLEIVALWHGGLIWYGGLAGGVFATWWWLARRRVGFLRGADQLIPFVALGHAIGRIGCFANGCCGGVPTDGWWGVTFPGSVQPVVPTQLLESAALVTLYFLLRALQRPDMLQRPGRIFGAYLIGYGLIRWALECWRTNERLLFGWTLSQGISALLVVIGVVLVTRWQPRRPALNA